MRLSKRNIKNITKTWLRTVISKSRPSVRLTLMMNSVKKKLLESRLEQPPIIRDRSRLLLTSSPTLAKIISHPSRPLKFITSSEFEINT